MWVSVAYLVWNTEIFSVGKAHECYFFFFFVINSISASTDWSIFFVVPAELEEFDFRINAFLTGLTETSEFCRSRSLKLP